MFPFPRLRGSRAARGEAVKVISRFFALASASKKSSAAHDLQTRRAAHMDVRRFPTEPGWRVGKSPRRQSRRRAFDFTSRHFFGDFLCASKESHPPKAEASFVMSKEQDFRLLGNDEQDRQPCRHDGQQHALRAPLSCPLGIPLRAPALAQAQGRSGVREPMARKQHTFTPRGERKKPGLARSRPPHPNGSSLRYVYAVSPASSDACIRSDSSAGNPAAATLPRYAARNASSL